MNLKNQKHISIVLVFFAIFLFFISQDSNAAAHSVSFLDDIASKFESTALNWQSALMNAAKFLFLILVTISLVWSFAQMAVRGAEISAFFFEFIRFLIFFGFYWWLLRNGPKLASSIIYSFGQLAGKATGIYVAEGKMGLTPGDVLRTGFEVFGMTLDNMSGWPWNMAVSLIGGLIGLICLLLMLILSINMLMLMCSAWIMIYAGIFTLGFGGSRWTSDIALNYFKHVISIGLQILALSLIVHVAQQFVVDYFNTNKSGFSEIKALAILMGCILVTVGLALKIPPILGGMITGSSIGNGGASLGFGTAAAAAGMAVGAAAAVASSGASSAAGALSAVKAAWAASGDGDGGGGKSGGGSMLSSAASSLTGSGNDSGNKNSDPSVFAKQNNTDAAITPKDEEKMAAKANQSTPSFVRSASTGNNGASNNGASNNGASNNEASNNEASTSDAPGKAENTNMQQPSQQLASGEVPQNPSFIRRVGKTVGILATAGGQVAAHNAGKVGAKTVGGKMARVIRGENIDLPKDS